MKGNLIGAWAFLIGVILALIAGLFGITELWVYWVLVIIGIVIGLLNVAGKESQTFMLASAVLVIVSSMGQAALGMIAILGEILKALLILFVPAAIIVALKTVFSIARR